MGAGGCGGLGAGLPGAGLRLLLVACDGDGLVMVGKEVQCRGELLVPGPDDSSEKGFA